MRKNMTIFIAITMVIFVSVLSGSVCAEIKHRSFTLSPHAGGYVFDSDQHLSNGPDYGLGFGHNYTDKFGIEAVFDYIDSESERSDEGDAHGYLYHLNALYHVTPQNQFVPYISAGIGGISIDYDERGDDSDVVINYGGGFKYFLTEALAFRTEFRHFYPLEDSVNNYMYTFGLSYQFGGKAREEAPPPPGPADSDGDGVNDDIDRCPGTAPGVSVDSEGCPPDSDGDGVTDDLDRCFGTPQGITVDSDGCPLDSDGDGVYDYRDKCPGTPSGIPVDRHGCPLDSDGDGVYDHVDKCPGTSPGVAVDDNGCPFKKIVILADVHFDFNRATLTDEAKRILRNNSAVLRNNPEVSVHIEGHSCAHGPEDYNLRLSERRANAVKEFMASEGDISLSRMNTISYGETILVMPEDPTPYNKNSKEAKANRRVHFEIIESME
jgi:OOP family OmpA-OmpF porin